jgi:peptidoglycan-N-acetylglucosamine deacetylase
LIRRLAASAALAGAALHAGPALAPVVPLVAGTLGIPRRQDDPDGVALTFDDGPHPEGTPAVLETLRDAGVPATFFLSGEQVARRPSLAAEIVAAGHRVELHCFRHRNQLRLTPRQLIDDAERAAAAIEEATGKAVGEYRPPYGIFSASGLRAIRDRGWRPILWSLWARDWDRTASPESIVRRATAGATAGDVLLLHDADFYSARGSWARTAAALPSILDELGDRGLRAVPLRGRG